MWPAPPGAVLDGRRGPRRPPLPQRQARGRGRRGGLRRALNSLRARLRRHTLRCLVVVVVVLGQQAWKGTNGKLCRVTWSLLDVLVRMILLIDHR